MTDTPPKKRTRIEKRKRIENFTPTFVLYIKTAEKLAEIEKYGALELLQEMIINNSSVYVREYVKIDLHEFINKLIEENDGLSKYDARLACVHASASLQATWNVEYDKMCGREYFYFSAK